MRLESTDVLVVVDIQRDFCPGGALAVSGGDEIIAAINGFAGRFNHVIVTQDWHPVGHISFASSHAAAALYEQIKVAYGSQTLWPDHCVQRSVGAALHPMLDLPGTELILRKGFHKEIDSYSAFLENDHRTPTGLAGYLRERGLQRLFFTGLAYDFCVRYSATDGKDMGFETLVVRDLTRAVNLPAAAAGKGSVEDTDSALAAAGIPIIEAREVMR